MAVVQPLRRPGGMAGGMNLAPCEIDPEASGPARRARSAGALGGGEPAPREQCRAAPQRRRAARTPVATLIGEPASRPRPASSTAVIGLRRATSWIQPVSSDSGTYTGARNSSTNTGIWISAPGLLGAQEHRQPHTPTARRRSSCRRRARAAPTSSIAIAVDVHAGDQARRPSRRFRSMIQRSSAPDA